MVGLTSERFSNPMRVDEYKRLMSSALGPHAAAASLKTIDAEVVLDPDSPAGARARSVVR